MFRLFKNWLKVFFSFYKSEQRGILVLLGLLFVMLMIYAGLPYLNLKLKHRLVPPEAKKEVERFVSAQQRMNDSMLFVKQQASGHVNPGLARRFIHPVLFDPNRVPAGTLKQMGLGAKQIKNLLSYRKHGGVFLKPADLLKVYGISKVEYQILADSIKIKPLIRNKINPVESSQAIPKVEINSCTQSELENRLHLPGWLARRVLKYRKLLGGFYSTRQLGQVYGMKPATLKRILPHITVNPQRIHRFDLEKVSLKTLLHHPYFDYETTKKLISFRSTHHSATGVDSVKVAALFSDSLWYKIRHYLYLRPLKK